MPKISNPLGKITYYYQPNVPIESPFFILIYLFVSLFLSFFYSLRLITCYWWVFYWNISTDIRFSVYVNKTLVFAFKDQPRVKSSKGNTPNYNNTPSSANKKGVDLPDNNNNNASTTNNSDEDEEILSFELSNPIPLVGDIKMDFYEKETFGSVIN